MRALTNRQTLYCFTSIHLICVFIISLCFGLCLSKARCVYTVIFNDTDFEELRDIIAPVFLISGFLVNIFAVSRLLQQLAVSHPRNERQQPGTKQP